MDMVLSAPVHQDVHLSMHIIDDAWASETLPVEDIEVPPHAITPVDDDEQALPNDEDEESKWNDLALDELMATLPPPVTQMNDSSVESSQSHEQQHQPEEEN